MHDKEEYLWILANTWWVFDERNDTEICLIAEGRWRCTLIGVNAVGVQRFGCRLAAWWRWHRRVAAHCDGWRQSRYRRGCNGGWSAGTCTHEGFQPADASKRCVPAQGYNNQNKLGGTSVFEHFFLLFICYFRVDFIFFLYQVCSWEALTQMLIMLIGL